MERNPKSNPKVGDIFRKGARTRRIIEITHGKYGGAPDIRYVTENHKNGNIFLVNFVRWADDAEVIHAA